MKNSKLLIASLFVSLTAAAQIKTGGGPDVTDLYTQDQIMVDKYMGDLMEELKENDYKCSKTPRLKLETSIVQVYVKLAVLENLEKSNEQCAEANKYLSCINTKSTVKHARDILAIKDSSQYIADQFGIKSDEAKKILKYFAYPEKKKK